jgi:hypothetical protein
MFHDTSIIDGLNILVFFLAGLTSGLTSQIRNFAPAEDPTVILDRRSRYSLSGAT